MKFVYANENHSTMINEKNGVVFLTFPKLVKAGVCLLYTSRDDKKVIVDIAQ